MKQKNFFFFIGIFSTFFAITSFATVHDSDILTQTLHKSLGKIIDEKENLKYNIFGSIKGLTAAKIYKIDSKKFRLHLLRNANGKAQILIFDLPFEKFSELRNSVADRINIALKKHLHFERPLYPIKKSKWTESSTTKKIVLDDGSQLIATLKRAQHDTLIVQTLGKLQIPIPDINIEKVIDLRGKIYKGKFFRTDPNTSRLFFAPTGRKLKAKNGYFADYYIFFPTLAFGVTDFFSISGGVSLIPGTVSQLLYFAPKFTFQISPQMGFGTGFLYLAIPNEEHDINLGYIVTTIGSDQSSVTLGAGLPLTSSPDKSPILLIGGETQISNRVKLITENWIFTEEGTTILFSGGIRFFGERLAVDLAFISSKEAFRAGGFPFIPWVDFSVFLGK